MYNRKKWVFFFPSTGTVKPVIYYFFAYVMFLIAYLDLASLLCDWHCPLVTLLDRTWAPAVNINGHIPAVWAKSGQPKLIGRKCTNWSEIISAATKEKVLNKAAHAPFVCVCVWALPVC